MDDLDRLSHGVHFFTSHLQAMTVINILPLFNLSFSLFWRGSDFSEASIQGFNMFHSSYYGPPQASWLYGVFHAGYQRISTFAI